MVLEAGFSAFGGSSKRGEGGSVGEGGVSCGYTCTVFKSRKETPLGDEKVSLRGEIGELGDEFGNSICGEFLAIESRLGEFGAEEVFRLTIKGEVGGEIMRGELGSSSKGVRTALNEVGAFSPEGVGEEEGERGSLKGAITSEESSLKLNISPKWIVLRLSPFGDWGLRLLCNLLCHEVRFFNLSLKYY